VNLSERTADFIHQKPGQCIAIMLVLTLVFGAGLANFSMTMDINDMLPTTEEVEALQEIQEDFFNTEAASVVTMEEPVLSPTYFDEVSSVVEAWAGTPKVRDNLVAAPERAIISIPTTLAQYDLMLQGNPNLPSRSWWPRPGRTTTPRRSGSWPWPTIRTSTCRRCTRPLSGCCSPSTPTTN